MKKFLTVFFSMILVFTLSSTAFANQQDYVPDPGGGGSISGAYIKSTYGTSRYSIVFEDFYMNVSDARSYANNATKSTTQMASWFAFSWIPKVGPYLSTIGFLHDLHSNELANAVRSYTDRNKAVQLTILKDSRYGSSSFIVREWKKGSAMKPYPAPQPSLQKEVARIYK